MGESNPTRLLEHRFPDGSLMRKAALGLKWNVHKHRIVDTQVPEDQNDLRKMQLRELAMLNGTFREGEFGPRCSNCGATTHKAWQCPDKPNVTNAVICANCGGTGHIARDCRADRSGYGQGRDGHEGPNDNKIDEEYMSLMAELGEGPPPKQFNQQGSLVVRNNAIFHVTGSHSTRPISRSLRWTWIVKRVWFLHSYEIWLIQVQSFVDFLFSSVLFSNLTDLTWFSSLQGFILFGSGPIFKVRETIYYCTSL